MKTVATLTAVFFFLASPAFAQAFKDFSLFTGYSLPTGTMTDEATGRLQLGGSLGLQVGPQAIIGFEYAHNWYGLSDEMQDYVDSSLGESGDLDLSISQYTLYGKIQILPNATTFYGKFSAGFYTSSATVSQGDIEVTVDETDFGLAGGLGYQILGRGRTGGFVEAMYHSILTEGNSTLYFDFRGGVTFRFL